jgi:hypothetical protein
MWHKIKTGFTPQQEQYPQDFKGRRENPGFSIPKELFAIHQKIALVAIF